MDAILTTLRTIHLALLTLCFASSIFLASLRNTPNYSSVITPLKTLLDAKAYLYPTDEVKETLREAQVKANADGVARIKADLDQAGFDLPKEQLDMLSMPTNSALQVMSETYTLLVNRRSLSNQATRPAQVFSVRHVEVSPAAVGLAKQFANGPCDVRLDAETFAANVEIPALDKPKNVTLVVRYGRNENKECTAKGGAIRLPVTGTYENVAGTSFEDWLKSRKLFEPPLFEKEKTGGVAFLNVDNELWSEILGKKPAEAYDYAVVQSNKPREKIKIFEVELERSLVAFTVPGLMFLILVTLYLHVENACRVVLRSKEAAKPSIPWIGNFDSRLAQGLYFGSIVIWPMALALGFAMQLYSASIPYFVSLSMWAGAVMSGVSAFLASEKLRVRMA